eukprot:TRINITY_DN24806_c0_g1_i1.p1 TRINITY_DN24806_c0_g1~~TRINITY_DN24806_c0_g1_i1.p1  ORF type:complete len:335 (+),score=161.50 TRINITY_DN24806_c0_g1_i1:55-1059(+)
MASEDLYELRNALATGNYTYIISEAPQVKPCPYSSKPEDAKALEIGRDYFLAMAQIGLGRHNAVVAEMSQSGHELHKAALHLAQYLKADKVGNQGQKDAAVEASQALVDEALARDGEAKEDSALMAVTAATVMIHAGELETAHKWMRTWQVNLAKKAEGRSQEQSTTSGVCVLLLYCQSSLVDIYLRINNTKHAEQELKNMKKIDEDSAITMLSEAWVLLRKGEKEARDAAVRFEDLKGKYGHTSLLLNGTALCQMAQGKYQDALSTLEEAQSSRDGYNDDTQINHMICEAQVNPTVDHKAAIAGLKQSVPNHPWVWKYSNLEDRFDELAAGDC